MIKIFLQILFIVNCSLPIVLSQWTKQTIPVSKPIVGIEFKDSLKGWAVTSSGSQFDVSYILNTTNGGTNWLLQYTGTDYSFDAFDMVDMNTGYVIGGIISLGQSRLFKTTNGGVNWVVSSPGVGIIFDDIFFPSRDSGFICASNSFGPGIWFTSNGGVSWQTRDSGTNIFRQTLFFLNNNTGWCGTGGQILYKTTNAGLNWINNGNFTEGIYSIYFLNINEGWLGASSDEIYHTTNGGLNWTTTSFPPLFGTIYDFYLFNNLYAFGGNRSLRILKTTNGGINWGYQIDSSASYKISFIDSLKGWSGDFGISKTTNGGGPITYVGIISNYNNIPKSYSLFQNYPNPFNSQTIIRFAINKTSYVKLKIYDILGREKALWQSDKQLGAGIHELSFDAKDLSSGVYFYQIIVSDESGNIKFNETRKMILVK